MRPHNFNPYCVPAHHCLIFNYVIINYKNPFQRGYAADIITSPFTIIFGASVSYSMLDFNLQYQYSGYEISAQGFDYVEKYKNHYLGFGVGVKM